MTKTEMKKYLLKQYELANERMFNMQCCEKLCERHYGERQAIGETIIAFGFMTGRELQHYLDELNQKIDPL